MGDDYIPGTTLIRAIPIQHYSFTYACTQTQKYTYIHVSAHTLVRVSHPFIIFSLDLHAVYIFIYRYIIHELIQVLYTYRALRIMCNALEQDMCHF